MKLKVLASALLGTMAVSGAMALKPEVAEAQAGFQFHCVQGGGGGYVTVVTNGQATASLITWDSHVFSRSGWTPAVRCREVTARFNHAVQNGIGLRLTTGVVNNLGVICALQGRQRSCSLSTFNLVTLNPGTPPGQALNQLVEAAAGGRPLAQSGSVTLNDWAGAALESQ